jgi:adenylate kinase family enzyme
MKSCRIHIMGASGAGVSSLGRALADVLAIPHHDTDDYFWRPTVLPYREMREAEERLRLMREVFLPRADWVLSGSLNGWGDVLIPAFDWMVFLATPREIRLQRLRAREATRFGTDPVAPGGWRHQETEEFILWASGYDEGDRASRNLAKLTPGLRHCPAQSCAWTDRGQPPNWSPKSAARSTAKACISPSPWSFSSARSLCSLAPTNRDQRRGADKAQIKRTEGDDQC